MIYSGTRPLKLSLKDLKQLRDALKRPPLNASLEALWNSFYAIEPERVMPPEFREDKKEQPLADLVNLVRHALVPNLSLVPYRNEVRERYQAWLVERNAEKTFTTEQREWLDRMAEHIASSLAIAPDAFETGWFSQHGSLGRANALFGNQLQPLIAELNERLAA